ncbi:FISUMP domain-containing protein [Elizabethkingia meningoseptica]|uniref:FISUMP domain-containing protein n=1 Tax=Elizabethkingia meningoseptica TaxID=238 RepID=UPI0008421023|nr:FISUMP domain-containing protein [Elizabethkingia meningoseptica]ODM55176.1 hypothetical protein BES09_01610 [Elizabethkingia meningoseptica]OHT30381.1 hypothetical protein BFF93_01615 [Elizabethkingia meningoseptica]OPC12117.1 hypothetical protein BAX93_06400 [Elizabethkingia meningoseptica]
MSKLYFYLSIKTAAAFAALSLILSTVSCRSTETEQISGKAEIKINFKGSSFENISELGKQASSSKNIQNQNLIQHQEIKLNNNLSIVAELFPQNSTPEQQPIAGNTNKVIAATGPSLLPNDICYKLLVYDNNGNYVAERDYIRGKENDTAVTPALLLNGGQTYTFVAYCINTNTIASLPAVTNKNTLAGATLNDIAGNSDFMYFKSAPIQMEGGTNNYLDIVLKHMFSQITTTLDASQTGYKIHTIDAGITPHYNKANIQLTDGGITRNDPGNTPVSFTLPTGNDINLYPASVSNTSIVNNDVNNNGVFTITSLRLGIGNTTFQGASIVNKNIRFENLKIVPGVKYNLNISLVPIDTYLTYMGIPAARINGQIWMRYNAGVTDINLTTNNPDQAPLPGTLYGSFFFWGIKEPYSASNNTKKSGPAGAWNNGTNYAPVKNQTYDPCPTGYRVPTTNEWYKLLEYTTSENIGTWDAAPVDFGGTMGAGKVLRSKRNTSVQLTLPVAGILHGALHVDYRGYQGSYWTSTEDGGTNNNTHIFSFNPANPIPATSTSITDKSYNQFSLRCIAE